MTLAVVGIAGAFSVVYAGGTAWQGLLILGFASVMAMDAASWTAVGANGSPDRLLTLIDFVGVVAAGLALSLAILAVVLLSVLVEAAVFALLLYTVCCALYWWRIPSADRFLMGDTFRAWREEARWDRVAQLYRLLFIFCSVITLVIWVIVAVGPIESIEHEITWQYLSILVFIYAGMYFFLGAPLKRIFSPRLPGDNVFLSYAHQDAGPGTDIAESIRKQGLGVFRDVDAAHVAPSLPQYLRSIIRGSDIFVVLLSADAVRSEWVKLEVHCAVESLHARHRPAIVPLLLDPAAESTGRALLEEAGLGSDPLLVEQGALTRQIEYLRRHPYDIGA